MSDPKNPLAWVAKAEEDYEIVLSATRFKKAKVYAACYHAQQSAEKYLKAILVAQENDFPKIHDLVTLSELCEKAGVIVPVDADKLDLLSDYAVMTRYPGEDPTPENARDALETAKLVRRFVRTFFGLK